MQKHRQRCTLFHNTLFPSCLNMRVIFIIACFPRFTLNGQTISGEARKNLEIIDFVIADFIAWNSPTSSFISVALSCRTARDNAFNRDADSLSSSDPLCFYSGRKVRGVCPFVQAWCWRSRSSRTYWNYAKIRVKLMLKWWSGLVADYIIRKYLNINFKFIHYWHD